MSVPEHYIKRNKKTYPAKVVNYNMTALADCALTIDALEYRAREESGLAPPQIVSTTMLWNPKSYPILAQWIAFHRLVGIEHFFVYLKEPWNETNAALLPSAPYITYRNWDVDAIYGSGLAKSYKAKDFFQTVEQTEAIYRARRWGGHDSIKWVTLTDTDEYLQPYASDRCEAGDMLCTLQPYEQLVRDQNISGIEVKSWEIGSHPQKLEAESSDLVRGRTTLIRETSNRDFDWISPGERLHIDTGMQSSRLQIPGT